MTLFIAYILNIIDYLFTSYWVGLYGIGIEANPIGRWLFTNNIAWVVKIFAVGGLLAVMGICIRKQPKLHPMAYIPFVVYGLIAVYHIIILSLVI